MSIATADHADAVVDTYAANLKSIRSNLEDLAWFADLLPEPTAEQLPAIHPEHMERTARMAHLLREICYEMSLTPTFWDSQS